MATTNAAAEACQTARRDRLTWANLSTRTMSGVEVVMKQGVDDICAVLQVARSGIFVRCGGHDAESHRSGSSALIAPFFKSVRMVSSGHDLSPRVFNLGCCDVPRGCSDRRGAAAEESPENRIFGRWAFR